MKTVIVIPARMKSVRLPGKPLVQLRGVGGGSASLIERCYRAACEVPGIAEVLVATDHSDIADHVTKFGGRAVMTSQDCRNGTERCAAVLERIEADLVVNFQGDAPLIPPDFVSSLIDHMSQELDAEMATPVMPCDRDVLAALRADRKAGVVGGTTVSFNRDYRALYFSKEVIPNSDAIFDTVPEIVHLHIGLYAYRPDVLRAYAGWPVGRLEEIEKLEQLRFLENGYRVDCVPVAAKGRAFWEVNNPDDIARVEAALVSRGIE